MQVDTKYCVSIFIKDNIKQDFPSLIRFISTSIWYSHRCSLILCVYCSEYRNTDLARISGSPAWFTAEIPNGKYLKSEIVLPENGEFLSKKLVIWCGEVILNSLKSELKKCALLRRRASWVHFGSTKVWTQKDLTTKRKRKETALSKTLHTHACFNTCNCSYKRNM